MRYAPPALILLALAAACGGGSSDSGPTTPPPVNTVATVQLAAGTVAVGGSVLRSATLSGPTGDTLTNILVTWDSENPAVARVSATGAVSGVAPGVTVIRATAVGVSGTATITVDSLLFVELSVGARHACARTASGVAYCWGDNTRGAGAGRPGETCFLGECSSTPTSVNGWPALMQLSSGGSHSCALGPNGTAQCWGENTSSQLAATSAGACAGTFGGSFSCSRQPLAVTGAPSLAVLASGDAHTCGLTATGTAWCWGLGSSGQLGISTSGSSAVARPITGGLAFGEMDAGARHTCGLTVGGTAWCWGDNASGQLGAAGTGGFTPVQVSGNTPFKSISAGALHTCALTTAGAAWCWGSNAFGQLGNDTRTNSAVPIPVATGIVFSRISAGSNHTCGLTTSGVAYCWGRNTHGSTSLGISNPGGQLGDGTTTDRQVPTPVARGLVFSRIEAGDNFTCALTAVGRVYCWGIASHGALGDGDMKRVLGLTAYRSSPVGVAGVP